MEKLELVISLAGTALTFLVTAVTFLIKFVKSVRAKLAAEGVVKICNAILPCIEQAETFLNYSGQEKKEYVMTRANRFAIENGIVFDPELISAKIEELVRLTKEVNAKSGGKGDGDGDGESATAATENADGIKTVTAPVQSPIVLTRRADK